MTRTKTTPAEAAEKHAAAEAGNIRKRRRGIYAMAVACVGFFVVAIGASYIAAIVYGYGTGFGDGKILANRMPLIRGKGFAGDALLFAMTVAIDLVILIGWYFAASFLDNATVDDPIAADDVPVDLADSASWYAVQVPGLTKALIVVAWACLAGIAIGAASLVPVTIWRFGPP